SCHTKIRVFQAAGAPAARVETDNDGAGVKRCQLPCHAFAPGIYFYKVDLQYPNGRQESKPLCKFVCSRD
ncbi:MAG TPA: hypothetical protein VNZ67_14135, partial [bacterium]|nr:hypothetical protein [bacterium]